MAGKRNISSASAKLPSTVYVSGISPKSGQASKTVGLTMTEGQAVKLATLLLAVAQTDRADGLISITGRQWKYSARHQGHPVSVIRQYGSKKSVFVSDGFIEA